MKQEGVSAGHKQTGPKAPEPIRLYASTGPFHAPRPSSDPPASAVEQQRLESLPIHLTDASTPSRTRGKHGHASAARRQTWSTTSSPRSSFASRRTSPRASSAARPSASPGAASSPTPPSSAATAPSTGRLPCWASSSNSTSPRTTSSRGSSPPPPSARVLFHIISSVERGMAIVVWDPVADEQWELPMPETVPFKYWDATVLCAAHAQGCDNLHCRGGPFLVAFVGATFDGLTSACVYSSEAAAWSEATSAEHPDAHPDMAMAPSALVGNTIYFISAGGRTIVDYDLGRRQLAFINTPFTDHAVLMLSEGGGLGLAAMRGSCRYLCSRDAAPDGTAAWTQRRVIELNTLLPALTPSPSRYPPTAVGFAEGLGVTFVRTDAGVLAVNLKSGGVKKVSSRGSIQIVIPYMSFYTPDHATG